MAVYKDCDTLRLCRKRTSTGTPTKRPRTRESTGFRSIAPYAFADKRRVIARDLGHSQAEERFYCIGAVDGGILTVRFAWRASVIRIIGAGYWRKGKVIYERENQIHR